MTPALKLQQQQLCHQQRKTEAQKRQGSPTLSPGDLEQMDERTSVAQVQSSQPTFVRNCPGRSFHRM